MEQIFNEIAKEEDCKYSVTKCNEYQHTLFASLSGVRIDSHTLKIQYKNHIINVINKVEHHWNGEVECEIQPKSNMVNFNIDKRSHYWRLFNKRKNILRIECVDSKLHQYLQDKLIALKLEEIARQGQFTPSIIGVQSEKGFVISTTYSLQFHNKEEVLRPLISFYKSVIDYGIIE